MAILYHVIQKVNFPVRVTIIIVSSIFLFFPSKYLASRFVSLLDKYSGYIWLIWLFLTIHLLIDILYKWRRTLLVQERINMLTETERNILRRQLQSNEQSFSFHRDVLEDNRTEEDANIQLVEKGFLSMTGSSNSGSFTIPDRIWKLLKKSELSR